MCMFHYNNTPEGSDAARYFSIDNMFYQFLAELQRCVILDGMIIMEII